MCHLALISEMIVVEREKGEMPLHGVVKAQT